MFSPKARKIAIYVTFAIVVVWALLVFMSDDPRMWL